MLHPNHFPSVQRLIYSLTQNEKLRAAIKRLRGAIAITFDKSKYEKCLTSLRDRNGDLSTLRLQITAFQQQTTCAAGTLVKHKTLPDRFKSIQNASQKLHEALRGAWCCDNLAHRDYAKLCLDAEVKLKSVLTSPFLVMRVQMMAKKGMDVPSRLS